MPRNGLTKEKVIEAAANWIEANGISAFSMRALAESLNIKTASLYNHIESMEQLLIEVCAYTLKIQQNQELKAIENKTGAESIYALANSYRNFAKEHSKLYFLTINSAVNYKDELNDLTSYFVDPFYQALDFIPLEHSAKIHWQRILRGILHGFVAQEEAGFFSHLPESVDESFNLAIQCYIDGLMAQERRLNQ